VAKQRKKGKGKESRGGWPRRAVAAPCKPKDGPSRESASRAMHVVEEVLPRVMRSLEAGEWSVKQILQRFRHLTHLLETHPALVFLRPSRRVTDEAMAAADRELDEQLENTPPDERIRVAADFFAPRLFDEAFVRRARGALTDALLDARSDADGEALALGCLSAAKEQWTDNPFVQSLVMVILRERRHAAAALEQTFRGIGLERLEAMRDAPAAFQAALEDASQLGPLMEDMSRDPVLQREARRLAELTVEELCDGIADGSVAAHLAAEEVAPVMYSIKDEAMGLHAKGGEEALDGEDEQEVAAAIARAFGGFVEAPANRPAFERFGKKLRQEAKDAAANQEPDAVRLHVYADLWTTTWESDPRIRFQVLNASIARLSGEGAEECADG